MISILSSLTWLSLLSPLSLMIIYTLLFKFDCRMSPLNFVLDDTRPYCCQIWLTYVSSHICTHPKNTCTRWYTLSFSNLMSYIFLVISVLDDKIHPVTFVLKWCFNILPTPSSCISTFPSLRHTPLFCCICMQYNIDLHATKKLHTSNGLPITEPTPWPPRHEEIAYVEWVATIDPTPCGWTTARFLCREYPRDKKWSVCVWMTKLFIKRYVFTRNTFN